jgi:hypothetical protein
MTTGDNMKTSETMFLRREGKRGHEPVRVIIDWSDVSDEDMKLMASFYVMNRAAGDLKLWDHVLPESVEYRAADFVHNEPLVMMPPAPDEWKSSGPSKAVNTFKEALKGLTPEEIRKLLTS